MNLRFASVCAASALGYLLSACKDSATTPAAQAAGPRPSLATVSDTGGGGGGPGNQSHFVSNGTSGFVQWSTSGSPGNPNFFTFGGPSGLITIDWSASGAFQQRSSGTFDVIFPGFRQHFSGVSTSSSANAAGSVVGVPVPPGSPGNIGTNQNVTIDISH